MTVQYAAGDDLAKFTEDYQQQQLFHEQFQLAEKAQPNAVAILAPIHQLYAKAKHVLHLL